MTPSPESLQHPDEFLAGAHVGPSGTLPDPILGGQIWGPSAGSFAVNITKCCGRNCDSFGDQIGVRLGPDRRVTFRHAFCTLIPHGICNFPGFPLCTLPFHYFGARHLLMTSPIFRHIFRPSVPRPFEPETCVFQRFGCKKLSFQPSFRSNLFSDPFPVNFRSIFRDPTLDPTPSP